MSRCRIPAVFYRGGTSRAILFKGDDLPADPAERDRIFLPAIGSPDPYRRQLDGLGGGVSSLSKVVIVAPSARDVADVDYTFVQVAVDRAVVDYGAMCGNMSPAVGPFAVEEGLVHADGANVTVRIFNKNTGKVFHATFAIADGQAVEAGEFVIPGVAGSGARVRLDYLDPGGAATGRTLPGGQPTQTLSVAGVGEIEASLVDVSNPLVFVRASDLGCTGMEPPAELEQRAELMARLDAIRRAGAVAMGLAARPDSAGLANPKVGMLAAPDRFVGLDGTTHERDAREIAARIVSMEKIHRAVPLTAAMCLAASMKIPGTVANVLSDAIGTCRIGNPSGVLPVEADVVYDRDMPWVRSTTTYRTQRRLMEGAVLYSGSA